MPSSGVVSRERFVTQGVQNGPDAAPPGPADPWRRPRPARPLHSRAVQRLTEQCQQLSQLYGGCCHHRLYTREMDRQPIASQAGLLC